MRFDLNVSVSHRPSVEQWREVEERAKAAGKARERSPGFWDRLSFLVPGREEFGWVVVAGAFLEPIADDVVWCLKEYLEPQVEIGFLCGPYQRRLRLQIGQMRRLATSIGKPY